MNIPDSVRYEGSLGIAKNTNLTPIEQIIEHHFADYLERNLKQAKNLYTTSHDKILDTDRARALSSVWNISDASRALLTTAVHNPSSAFIHMCYQEMLRQNRPGMVIFTAGGGGSGKSVALGPFAQKMQDALLIYDTTLSNQTAAVEKIEDALQLGRSIVIIFVYRPFTAAVLGVIHRALLSGGRTVPLGVLAHDHVYAPRTVLHIANHYAGNDNVQVILLDNSGNDVSDVKVIIEQEEILQFLTNIAYNDVEIYARQAKGVLENEKRKNYLPECIVVSLERNYQR